MRHIKFQKSSAASTLFVILLFTFILGAMACRSSSNTNAPDAASAGLVIVNAPATGEVRRVIASEGVPVNEGALILEIAVQQETPSASLQTQQGEDAPSRARRAAQSAQAQVAAARAEAERASVEVERMTALVASNSAPQPQLDAARVQYQRAQEQLQRVQQNVSATAAMPPQVNSMNTPQVAATTPREQIITVRASTAGTVRAIGVSVGQQVTTGQALATIRTNDR